ncbi:hypothetical protein EJ06DRAFT_315063 [Trichodelitschia bisporula]|uniref:LYR motif-containing protein 2 n=1 Tax=Trichodelitschia bisporula TaxID=703511 RepID=A0A6G1I4E9_9PEZI|nr:hypothetical protein EJ06DRAFT_315063 [Trichodelitschia bisporula]
MLVQTFLRSQPLNVQLRTLASKARKHRLPPDGPILGLDHFLQRARVLAFWRSIVREVNKIPSPAARQEMRQYARGEFERHRHITDIDHIRYLLSERRNLTQCAAILRNSVGSPQYQG